jgi:mannose-6-phosphate isomerase-like protein (cupin superfamily)
MSVANLNTTSKIADTETLDVLGPHIQFLTAVWDADHDYCMMWGTVPAGVVVPLHSHAERETFYVLEGEIQGVREDRWITLGVGDVFDARRPQTRLAKRVGRIRIVADCDAYATGQILPRYRPTRCVC